MKGFIRKARAGTLNLFTHPVALAIAGAGLLVYFSYLIYHPAAYAVGGIFLLLAAWDASR
jgi:hypothetical protein